MARLIGGGSAPVTGAGTGEAMSVMVDYFAASSRRRPNGLQMLLDERAQGLLELPGER